ncbi:Protein of unknown function (DUF3405) [Geosmithia morbida]|uniref:Major facilitator superfamily transporter n=1 Tax=Geosmithia morbida TaxID=1094350 RepID=A0A9P4Z1J2_9HYPO|nr:Protein of unknown function (DUF3405) [Geosmithia morbida]KAF4125711.1 Protein of unknown function (DUF3405) [Geosmithia morbida]
MFSPPSSRRSRSILLLVLASVTAYYLIFSGPTPSLHVIPYVNSGGGDSPDQAQPGSGEQVALKDRPNNSPWNIDISEIDGWQDPDDNEDPNDVEPGEELDGTWRDPGAIARLKKEKDSRRLWRYLYKVTKDLPGSNLIYGNTLDTLDYKEDRTPAQAAALREDPDVDVSFTEEQPVRFNPYPDYNSDEWKSSRHAPYVPCKGATGELIEDLLVFKGRPHDFPEPRMGHYDPFGLDFNICWERETRLGPYGFTQQMKKIGGESEPVDWDNVNWGDLQRRCVHKNAKRFDLHKSRENPYLDAYPETAKDVKVVSKEQREDEVEPSSEVMKRDASSSFDAGAVEEPTHGSDQGYNAEKRTALLLRAYTGKEYTENDKHFIRAMINELSLKSGGEYEVYLLVHVREKELRIFDDPETYQKVLHDNIPPEFHGMTVLWNDEVVGNIYTQLTDSNERSVHTAQWLSVQKFSHDHPQFDFIWNWEMDFRSTGHHYDMLDKIGAFARRQPRKGLWERSERYYIPAYHGNYDTDFRQDIEDRHGNETIWGPPELPFIHPVGPKPPVDSPDADNYEWGVGEDADVITLNPIVNAINSNWIMAKDVWGYSDENHPGSDLPRRVTIVTHSRISKRLLDVMHVENMRGNHIASEMTPQTVALLHGLKAVFAPHPVFMDRDWDGDFLAKWFNPGLHGESGGHFSPYGWGRERRYQGTTWYYRAVPPNRMFNNWMGWIDTGFGGKRWEQKHGRPCLPSMMLHPIKDSVPTKKGYKGDSNLPFG